MQNIDQNYESMPLSQIYNCQENLVNDLYVEVDELNDKFNRNSFNIDTDIIFQLLENLSKINYQIEIKKQKNSSNQESGPGISKSKGIPPVVWITLGIETIAFLALGAVEILNFVSSLKLNKELRDLEQNYNISLPSTEASTVQTLSVIKIALFIASTAVFLPLVSFIREIGNEKDKQNLSNGISALRGQNEKLLDFFRSFQNFKQKVDPSANTSKSLLENSFAECIRNLDRAPNCELMDIMPSRDHWISLMLSLLPELHPVTIHLSEIYQRVAEIISENSSSTAYSEDSNSSSTHHSIKNSKTKETPRKFRGEQIPKPNKMYRINELSNDIHFLQVQDIDKHQNLWVDIENTLGVEINRIQLAKNVAVDRMGNIANDITELEPEYLNINSEYGNSSSTYSYREV